MSFPLGALGADGAAAVRSSSPLQAPPRWRQQLLLGLGAVAWLLFVLALVTHHPGDAAFTTSGTGGALHNKAGQIGAWVSDLVYFLFGFSAWWLVPVALRAWLSALAHSLRSEDDETPHGLLPATVFWSGLALLLAASAALEWTRLYRWESLLPGHAGGVLGYTLGPLSMYWLGFAGSGVLWIAGLVAGMSLALRFSWLHVADAIGERIDALRERRAGKKEIAEDRRIGEQALREREVVVEQERHVVEDHLPIVIEPPVVNVPKSERVAKERQQPLFVANWSTPSCRRSTCSTLRRAGRRRCRLNRWR